MKKQQYSVSVGQEIHTYEKENYAGTFDEFRNFIIERIYEDCKNNKKSKFEGYAVAFCNSYTDTNADIKDLFEDANGWYGVEVLKSPFEDTSNRQFISNYFGGGDFGVCDIFLDDLDKEYVAREVDKMLMKTFGWAGERSIADDICVWELS